MFKFRRKSELGVAGGLRSDRLTSAASTLQRLALPRGSGSPAQTRLSAMTIESTWAEDCADGRAEAARLLTEARLTGCPISLFAKCHTLVEGGGPPTGHSVGFFTAIVLEAVG